MSTLPRIDARTAAEWLKDGAILVDIREPDEHARMHIPGARHVPLSTIDAADLAAREGETVVFHCASGARTTTHARRLAGKAPGCRAYVMDGGIGAWRAAGLPVASGR